MHQIRRLHDLAEDQHGYFSRAQAVADGIPGNTLTKLAATGTIERVSRGVYRLARYPVVPTGQLFQAVLWPQDGVVGVLSHASALALYGLSDVSPAKVHITLPRHYRVRRAVPAYLVVHHADLPPEDVTREDGLPVTTPARAVLDGHASHLGPALIRQAIEDGECAG
jgi:predicted transcriptional regulator of viral defense system